MFPKTKKGDDIIYSGIVHTSEIYLYCTKIEIEDIYNRYKKYVTKVSKTSFSICIYDVTITFVNNFGFTTIKIDFIKLLNSTNILPNDIEKINYKIYAIIFSISNYSKDFVLKRFDFRLDIKFKNQKEIDFLFNLYKKTRSNLYTLKKNSMYGDTLYYKSQSQYSSLRLNIYKKESQLANKKRIVEDFEKNIVRYEVQLCNRHLNYKKSCGFDKEIDTYLKSDVMQYYFNRYIKPVIFSGNYYCINEAKIIIKEKVESKLQQEKIIAFIITISRGSIDTVIKKYSGYEYNKLIKILEDLDINPILIPKNKNVKYFPNPLNNFFKTFPF